MLILKVHEVYEYWEVRPAQGKVKDVKFRAYNCRKKQSLAQNGSITLLNKLGKIQEIAFLFIGYRTVKTKLSVNEMRAK